MRLPLRCLLLPLMVFPIGFVPLAGAADGDDRDPVPFRLSRPAYPESLVPFRIRGEARLAFDIDADGYVSNLEVIYATHPDFIPPVLKVAQTWRYRAARKDGKPVPVRWKETMYSDVVTIGADPLSIPEKAPAELPAEYHYDVPPSIESVVQVVYPFDALIDGRDGSAEVGFVIDLDGRPRDVSVRKASRPEFGQALAAAMAAWRFKPAMKNGAPSPALLIRGQQFSLARENVLLTATQRRLREVMVKTKEDIVDYNLLDTPPAPIERVPPVYPEKFLGKPGNAEIEFILDREGRAQLPRIVSASAPEFGYAAATAVSQWKFEPPKKDGVAVDSRVRVPLVFNPSKAEQEAAAANEAAADTADSAAPPPGEAPPAAATDPEVKTPAP